MRIKEHFDNSVLQFYRIKNKFVRFLFVGVLNSAFSFSIYSLLIYIGVHYTISVFVSSTLGVLFNYKTTGKLVFEHHNNKLIFKFIGVFLFTYLLSIGSLRLLFMINVDKYSGVIIIALPIAVVSFFLNKKFVFKNKVEIV